MIQILFQRRFIKLSQKLRLGGRVQLANLIDELTFGHKVFTFRSGGAGLQHTGRFCDRLVKLASDILRHKLERPPALPILLGMIGPTAGPVPIAHV
jgi:hypothetical protein